MSPSSVQPLRPRPNVVRRGQGLPVVAIHGNGVDHRLLLALDDTLSEAGGLERVYLDLPGFGATPPLPGLGGLPELAEWLVAGVEELMPNRPFALLANSLGGLLARHLSRSLPDRVVGMALLAPVVEPDATLRRLPEFEVVECDEELVRGLDEDDRREFTDMTVRQTRQSWVTFERFVLPGLRAADGQAMSRLGARYFLPPEETTPQTQVEGPSLVIAGKQDQVVGYRDQLALLAEIPHATYAALDGAGHNLHVDQPHTVGALLRQWGRDLVRTL